MNTNDVFIWNDGFWCFREEYSREFGRGSNYQVLLRDSEKWLAHTRESFSLSESDAREIGDNANDNSTAISTSSTSA